MGGNILTWGNRFIRQLDFPNEDGEIGILPCNTETMQKEAEIFILLNTFDGRLAYHVQRELCYKIELSDRDPTRTPPRPPRQYFLITHSPTPCLGGTLTISHPLTNECRHRAQSLYKTAYLICTVFSRHNYVNLHVRSPQGWNLPLNVHSRRNVCLGVTVCAWTQLWKLLSYWSN